ncbi:MAG: fimbrillin family protein [Prevotellaceae bacterium]|jgi:hypothetical protein|nr:fimbrillin family protein [Prevotellaceae bacterium]
MKKVYILAAVAAALSVASCATDEVVDPELTTEEAAPIGFGTFLDRVSRGSAAASPKAAVLTDAGLKAPAAGFKVLAYSTGVTDWATYVSGASANPNFMDDQPVTWGGTSWKYAPAKYWPRKDNTTWGKVTFFALSNSNDASADGQANNNPKIGFTVQQRASDQVDLVAAVVTDKTGEGDGKVKFNFRHILSKIGFTAKLDQNIDTVATTIKVKYLVLKYEANKISAEGTYTFPSKDTIGSWSLTSSRWLYSDTPDTLFSGNDTLKKSTPINLCATANTYLMLIPQATSPGNLSVTLVYDVITTASTLTLASDTTVTTLPVGMPAATWEAAKEYTYNLTVKPKQVTIDPATEVFAWNTYSPTTNIDTIVYTY